MTKPTSMPTSQTVWNAILTVVGAALLAAIGFLYNEVTTLKEMAAGTNATRFTEVEASRLRSDMTVTLTEIDKRLAVMENNNDWIRQWVTSGRMPEGENVAPKPAPVPPKPTTFDDIGSRLNPPQQTPRYDLRDKK